ncbi:MAG: hypothetical protein II864_12325 [Prevotella sp.]|nr:hypothetical protein [Prevotella sp.]
MIHKKLLSLLVLLMTAASGAWAEEVTIGDGTETTRDFPIDNYFNYSCTEEIYTADEIGTKGTINAISFYYHYGTPYEASNVKMFMKHVTRSAFTSTTDCEPLSETDLVWTGNIAPTEEGWFTFTLDTPFEYNGTDNLLVAFYDGTNGYAGTSYTWRQTASPDGAYMALSYFNDNIIPDPYNLSNYSGSSKSLYTYRANIKLDIESFSVEISDDMTEATFTMPAFDATVNYDIVRDMEDADNPVEFSGLAQKVVVKKKTGTGTYEPLSELNIQLIDQLAATDAQDIIADAGIKVKVLKGTDNNGTITYDETNPITLTEFLADMQPGLYKMVAEPADATTSPYTGTASLAFEAIAGFPVEIAAQEYVTYYSANDNLTLEENSGAKLYTITGIGETKATATEIPSANKEMPFLVYNPTEETKTFLLIPTDAEINQTYADEFKGTATATTIAASTDAQTNYAFNGKQFVWVRTALPVAANKAWLEVLTSTARSIALLFADDDATAISAVSGSPADKAAVYDLSGRKVTNPAKKGVYIVNGKKVVVK